MIHTGQNTTTKLHAMYTDTHLEKSAHIASYDEPHTGKLVAEAQ